MSDITINTKRASTIRGFDGLSDNDLIRIAAQAIDYASEISLTDSQTTTDESTTNNDHETTMANVVRDIRDSDSIDRSGAMMFSFEYSGMTFEVMSEEIYEARCEEAKDSAVEDAQYEAERLIDKNAGYLSNYVKFDEDAFRRDLEHDMPGMVSHYDGEVHEMYWNEYTSGDSTLVTRRETLYMIRED